MFGIRSAGSNVVFRLRDVVEARVVHQRWRVAHRLEPLAVADFFGRIGRARFHVVLEAERVPDFVGDDVFEQARPSDRQAAEVSCARGSSGPACTKYQSRGRFITL